MKGCIGLGGSQRERSTCLVDHRGRLGWTLTDKVWRGDPTWLVLARLQLGSDYVSLSRFHAFPLRDANWLITPGWTNEQLSGHLVLVNLHCAFQEESTSTTNEWILMVALDHDNASGVIKSHDCLSLFTRKSGRFIRCEDHWAGWLDTCLLCAYFAHFYWAETCWLWNPITLQTKQFFLWSHHKVSLQFRTRVFVLILKPVLTMWTGIFLSTRLVLNYVLCVHLPCPESWPSDGMACLDNLFF